MAQSCRPSGGCHSPALVAARAVGLCKRFPTAAAEVELCLQAETPSWPLTSSTRAGSIPCEDHSPPVPSPGIAEEGGSSQAGMLRCFQTGRNTRGNISALKQRKSQSRKALSLPVPLSMRKHGVLSPLTCPG